MARADLSQEEVGRVGGQSFLPGMPAEVHIRTGECTALSHLMKPLADQIARAMREE